MKYKKTIIIILLVLVVAAIGLAGYIAINNKDYVVSINGENVSAGEYKFMLESIKDKIMADYGLSDFNTIIDGRKASDVAKDRALESITNFTIEYQNAKKKNINLSTQELTAINTGIKNIFSQNTEDAIKIKNAGLNENQFKKVYVKFDTAKKYRQQMLSDIQKNITITDEAAKEYYTKNIEDYTYEKVVRVRHILFKTIDENGNPLPKEQQDAQFKNAQEILKRAKGTEDFASLAKQYSEDEGSKNNGGEYTFTKGDMVKEFENASFALKPGEISDLVKTEYGYHIIKLEAIVHEKGQTMSFEENKEAIKIDAQYDKLLEDWKKNSKIIRNDKIYNSL